MAMTDVLDSLVPSIPHQKVDTSKTGESSGSSNSSVHFSYNKKNVIGTSLLLQQEKHRGEKNRKPLSYRRSRNTL